MFAKVFIGKLEEKADKNPYQGGTSDRIVTSRRLRVPHMQRSSNLRPFSDLIKNMSRSSDKVPIHFSEVLTTLMTSRW